MSDDDDISTKPYLWLVVVGGFVCFAYAWGIGANDVGNALATSVGSGALTLKSAVMIAAVFEFLGAFLLGGSVTDTLKGDIVNSNKFEGEADILILGFFCSLSVGSVILFVATYWALPISTSQTVVGAIIGFVIVSKGFEAVHWDNVLFIALFWIITPLASAVTTLLFYLFVATFWLRKDDSTALLIKTWWFFSSLVFSVMIFFLLLNGLDHLHSVEHLSVLTRLWIAILSGTFIGVSAWMLLWSRGILQQIADGGDNLALFNSNSASVPLPRMRASQMDSSNENSDRPMLPTFSNSLAEAPTPIPEDSLDCPQVLCVSGPENDTDGTNDSSVLTDRRKRRKPKQTSSLLEPKRSNKHVSIKAVDERKEEMYIASNDSWSDWARNMYNRTQSELKKGVEMDMEAELTEEERNLRDRSEKFDPSSERLFGSLQIISAIFGIFSHGSNDAANAIAPFAAMVSLYHKPDVSESVDTPLWILALGGGAMVVGLATYGYRVIQTLGSRLAVMTCSRGYIVEVSSALFVIMASNYGFPVSTTHAKVGAVVGIACAEAMRKDGTLTINEVINWKLLMSVLSSWVWAMLLSCLCTAAVFAFLAHTPSLDNRK